MSAFAGDMDHPTFRPAGHHCRTVAWPHLGCPVRGARGAGNSAHRACTGQDRPLARLRCPACGHQFSVRRGPVLEGSKRPEETVERLRTWQRWGGRRRHGCPLWGRHPDRASPPARCCPARAIGLAEHVWCDRDDLWYPAPPDPRGRQLVQRRVKARLTPALEPG